MFTYKISNCSVEEIVSLLMRFDPYSDKPYSFRDNEDLKEWPQKLSDKAKVIVCNHDVDVVGCLFFYANDIAKKNKEGYCIFFCVLPDYRRCGIASEMIKRVKSYLSSEEIPYFKLKCAKANIPAFKLYQKMGFDIINEDGRTYTMVAKTR